MPENKGFSITLKQLSKLVMVYFLLANGAETSQNRLSFIDQYISFNEDFLLLTIALELFASSSSKTKLCKFPFNDYYSSHETLMLFSMQSK